MSAATQFRNSDLLRSKLALCSSALDAVYGKLWSSDRLDRMVPAFLILVHQVARATVPLMECAAGRCREISDEPLAEPLERYYARHAEEERDHDAWLMEDLRHVGLDAAAVAAVVPKPVVAQLSGAQYYWVLHHHPIALLGYILVLEASPPTDALIDRLRDASGCPEAAFRTLRLHCQLDPGHRDDLDAFLDSLTLTRVHHELITTSILHTVQTLAASVQSLEPVTTGLEISGSFR